MECQAIFVMHNMTLEHPITEEVGSPKCPHGCGATIPPISGEPLESGDYYCSECGHINGKCGVVVQYVVLNARCAK
jgi:hypothetical protein